MEGIAWKRGLGVAACGVKGTFSMRCTGWFNATKKCAPRVPAEWGRLGTMLETYQWKWWVLQGVSGSNGETEGQVVPTRTQEETASLESASFSMLFLPDTLPKSQRTSWKDQGHFLSNLTGAGW